MPFIVEIWSDVVCPWCYLGKRRFESALSRFEHRDDVEVVWRSFELDPNAERNPTGTSAERLAAKYGMSPEEVAASHQRLTGFAAEVGLEYHLDRTRGGNTFDAHRLIQLGKARGVQDAVKERLMRAYFTDAESIDDHETLVRLAADAGLGAGRARARRAPPRARLRRVRRRGPRRRGARPPDRHQRRPVLRPRPPLRRVRGADAGRAARGARQVLGSPRGRVGAPPRAAAVERADDEDREVE